MKNMRTGSKVGLVLLCAAVMSACSANTDGTSTVDNTSITSTQGENLTTNVQLASVKFPDLVTFDEEDSVTDWSKETATMVELSGTSATISGSGSEVTDGTVTITDAGTYVLSGTLSDGQIVVDNQDKGTVRLVLNGVNITDSNSAAIYIKEAGKVVMTLQEGTENAVSDGATYVFTEDSTDEPSATIFSKADLTINGTGKLSVAANYNDGITSKDDLKIMAGTIDIHAKDDGMVGKDLVAVQEGTIAIVAEGDGIKSTNDEDATKGFIAIAAGSFDIKTGNDGIQAETSLVIDGGTYTMVTGGGSENGEVKANERGQGMGMGMRGDRNTKFGSEVTPTTSTSTETPATPPTETLPTTEASATTVESETSSTKGLKAGADITVNNGSFIVDAADDAVHSNSNISITDGEFAIVTGDDGVHADGLLSIAGGNMDITKSYEGIEGANIAISGGEIHVVASDDGVNVAGGNDEENTEGGRQDQFSESSNHLLTMSGGTLTIDATGDGLDSNGSIAMSGGTIIVNGPTNSGNGALDFDGSFEQSGGILVAVGSSGMLQAPSDDSSQSSVIMTFGETQQAGTMVHLEDSEGNTILTFAPSKEYQSVVISSPELKETGSYTLYSGGTINGSETNGLYTDGEYVGGTKVVAFDISSRVTWLNESGVTTSQSNHGPGGGGGGRNRTEGGKAK